MSLLWAGRSNSSTASITDDVSLHHAIGLQVLAALLGTSHLVVWASVKVTAHTTLGSTEPGAQGDSRVVSGVTDIDAQRLGEDENIVLIVLVDPTIKMFRVSQLQVKSRCTRQI